ncbi:MAG: hypothetical protein DCF15_19850 [Phormidesmis priestleyi]|uniref:Uncharacterized protein n=1 Tax=Phormidesmis priestleyi TaxID=268141 RepID=A0A2W4WNU4_9CYAN|nr:MAG: hypothetical protein DCF15_19850 [Phormidesmis priestleyi]
MSDPLPNPIQLKILRLEGQLRDRQVKYDREKALLGGISGGAEYQIEQNLERLESDISRLTDEVTAAQTQLNGEHIVAVIRYLEDYWNTERQTCEQAFRRSLPPNSWAIEAETPATIAGIVNTLAKSGQDSDCLYTPLAIFVGKLLRQNSLYINSPDRIRRLECRSHKGSGS